MDQAQALSAFENGIGDGAVLWAPHAYVGEAKGWVLAGNPKLCKLASPCVLVADRKYADAHPDVTAKFLSIYLRAANMLQKEAAGIPRPRIPALLHGMGGQGLLRRTVPA